MASNPSAKPKWIYDRSKRLYYYHDPRSGDLVYQDGTRQSAASTPRSPPADSPVPDSGLALSTSPTAGFYQPQAPGRRQDPAAGLHHAFQALNVVGTSSYERPKGRPQVRFREQRNDRTRVRTKVATEPAELITDPVFLESGITAHALLAGTGSAEGETEVLYSTFRIRSHEFFKVGRIFLILWAEPAGESKQSGITSMFPSDHIVKGTLGERVYSKVRRFVVIREGGHYCSALPISTYNGRGVSKSGVIKSEHVIIHSGRNAPSPIPEEEPERDEEGLRPWPIRVVPDERDVVLDPMSRLDLAKIHTIQHNLKVQSFGIVHPHSEAALVTQFDNVWASIPTNTPGRSARQEQSARDDNQERDDDENEDDEEEEEGEGEEEEEEEEEDDDDDEHDNPEADAADWHLRRQYARNAAQNLIQQGHSREQAFVILRANLQQRHGLTAEDADAELRALLR